MIFTTIMLITMMIILIRRLSQLLSITNPHIHNSLRLVDSVDKDFDDNDINDGGFICFTGLTRFTRIISVTNLHVP